MTPTPLAAQIALRIVEMIQTGEVAPGSHVRETAIAEEFRVSRSPVRDALHLLAKLRIVKHHRNRGHFISTPSRAALEVARKSIGAESYHDAIYREIAAQRLDGELAETFTEADLARQFDLSKSEVGRIVDRMAQEGWIERQAGYGWSFVPILTTVQSFDLSYRFRRAIESAALLEPTFAPDAEAFARCRAEQQALAEGHLSPTDPVALFQFGSRFHEMLSRCSGNPFFFDALQRVNRLRRLLEYRLLVDTRLFLTQAREHLVILDLVEAGKMKAAASTMGNHLDKIRKVKLQILRSKGRPKQGNKQRTEPKISLHF